MKNLLWFLLLPTMVLAECDLDSPQYFGAPNEYLVTLDTEENIGKLFSIKEMSHKQALNYGAFFKTIKKLQEKLPDSVALSGEKFQELVDSGTLIPKEDKVKVLNFIESLGRVKLNPFVQLFGSRSLTKYRRVGGYGPNSHEESYTEDVTFVKPGDKYTTKNLRDLQAWMKNPSFDIIYKNENKPKQANIQLKLNEYKWAFTSSIKTKNCHVTSTEKINVINRNGNLKNFDDGKAPSTINSVEKN